MAIIYETTDFVVKSPEKPYVYVDRLDGGHIAIRAKFKIRDRTLLTPAQAIEYTKLSMAAGEALKLGMAKRGVEVGLVNYQDMGNWTVFKPEGPNLHMHLFGRAVTAKAQKYGDAVQLPHIETGFFDSFQPLNDGDVSAIKEEIEKLMKSEKYRQKWAEDASS